MDNLGSRHGRQLSVPSISTSHPQTQNLEAISNNLFLSASPDPSSVHMNWSSGSGSGRNAANARSRSASVSCLTSPITGQGVNKKKVVAACQRCRTRKIKCDGKLPSCGNCVKAAVVCLEVDKSGERDRPRSHILMLENRIQYLEGLLSSRLPDVDPKLVGPQVELRSSRQTPPAIRIITTDLNPTSPSNTSSPQVSGISTPPSFDYSPLSASGQYLLPLSPYSLSEGPGSTLPSPSLSPSSPFTPGDEFMSGGYEGIGQHYLDTGKCQDDPRMSINNAIGNELAENVGRIVLGMADEPEGYIGPSSGYEFAKTIFADCPPLDLNQTLSDGPAEGGTNGPFLRCLSSCSNSTTDGRVNSDGEVCACSSNCNSKGGSASPSGPAAEGTMLNGFYNGYIESCCKSRVSNKQASKLPSREQSLIFVRAYFDNVQPQFPFLDRNVFDLCLEATYGDECSPSISPSIRHPSSPFISLLPSGYTPAAARFQVFMVLAIGMNISSAKQEHDSCNVNGYFVSARLLLKDEQISVRGSLQGLQNGLLLAMYSLHADTSDLGIWVLNSTLVAGCTELGLHVWASNQKVVNIGDSSLETFQSITTLRTRIFWSIYTLDRSIGIALGRPFALDEGECDINLPEDLSLLLPSTAYRNSTNFGGGSMGNEADIGLQVGIVYFLRMTRLLSIIKTTLYRTKTPLAFEPSQWQLDIKRRLQETREQAQMLLPTNTMGDHSQAQILDPQRRTIIKHLIDLKYHEAVQLLCRPSPRIPKPCWLAIEACMESAMATIETFCKLRALGEMDCGWLSALNLFLSGLSMLKCFKLWWTTMHGDVDPSNRPELEDFRTRINNCSELLKIMSKRWKVMMKAKQTFDTISRAFLSILLLAGSRWQRTANLGTNQPIPQIQVQSSQFLVEEELSPQSPAFPSTRVGHFNSTRDISQVEIKQDMPSLAYIPDLQLTRSDSPPLPPCSQHQQMMLKVETNPWLLNQSTPAVGVQQPQLTTLQDGLASTISWANDGRNNWELGAGILGYMNSQQLQAGSLQQGSSNSELGTERDIDSSMWEMVEN